MSATPNDWQQQNLEAIYARLQPLRELKEGTIYTEPSGIHFHVIIKSDSSLCFLLIEQTDPDTGVIQSEIDLDQPLRLMESYTQAMLLGLIWHPQPSRVYMAGLGGGRVPLLLHHYLPTLQLDCTDIDPAIVEIAKQFFGIQPDERLHVAIEDGRQWLATRSTLYDIIFLDVFLDNGYSPYRMTTVEFFELCRSRLVPGGVVVINLLANDPFLAAKAHTLDAVFGHVYSFIDPGENVILFATAGNKLDADLLRSRAAKLDAIHAFPFPFRELGERVNLGLGDLTTAAASAPLLTDADPPPGYFDTLPSFDAPYSEVAPDLPCPCGSGLPYANCHGAEANQPRTS
ncbi:MAG: fused MFS/spermidine synthase [Caldilineaceae bacterium]|nr:fused MFS/spermidine synthase [Caldilineaceae bacterium]